jgi:hypothetical protein
VKVETGLPVTYASLEERECEGVVASGGYRQGRRHIDALCRAMRFSVFASFDGGYRDGLGVQGEVGENGLSGGVGGGSYVGGRVTENVLYVAYALSIECDPNRRTTAMQMSDATIDCWLYLNANNCSDFQHHHWNIKPSGKIDKTLKNKPDYKWSLNGSGSDSNGSWSTTGQYKTSNAQVWIDSTNTVKLTQTVGFGVNQLTATPTAGTPSTITYHDVGHPTYQFVIITPFGPSIIIVPGTGGRDWTTKSQYFQTPSGFSALAWWAWTKIWSKPRAISPSVTMTAEAWALIDKVRGSSTRGSYLSAIVYRHVNAMNIAQQNDPCSPRA